MRKIIMAVSAIVLCTTACEKEAIDRELEPTIQRKSVNGNKSSGEEKIEMLKFDIEWYNASPFRPFGCIPIAETCFPPIKVKPTSERSINGIFGAIESGVQGNIQSSFAENYDLLVDHMSLSLDEAMADAIINDVIVGNLIATANYEATTNKRFILLNNMGLAVPWVIQFQD